MATGGTKMSFNHYQNGKYGTVPPQPGKDMEVTQDMHLKMSKKIAQLTKVIYALNTRNDEHDAIIQNIKEQHEEEIQRIISETKSKIEYYKNQIGGELDHKRKLESLQQTLLHYEKEKSESMVQIEAFKKEAEERERKLKIQHSSQMVDLSQEVLQTKKDFEAKLSILDSIKDQYERDKEEACDNLRKEHQAEIDRLQNEQVSKHTDLSLEKQRLEDKYGQEFAKLSKKCEDLEGDKNRLIEEYEGKLNKAQAFYEKELAALQDSYSSNAEEQLLLLQKEKDKLEKDFAFQDSQNKKRIDDLIRQLSENEEKVEKYRNELEQVQNRLHSKDSDSTLLSEQLLDAKKDASQAVTKLKEVETELAASRDRCEQQAKELIKKSTDIGELEATRMQNESMIKDLQGEVNKLKDRVKWLEAAKKALEDKGKVQENEQIGTLRSLEKALEDMSIEKQVLVEKYEKELKIQAEKAHQREQELRTTSENKLSDLTQKYTTEAEMERREAEEYIKKLKEDLRKQLEKEQADIMAGKNSLQSEYEAMKADLTSKLKSATDEVQRLENVVRDSEQGLGSASSQISSLKDSVERLKSELDTTSSQLRLATIKNTNLESEYKKLKLLHESKMKEAQEDLKSKLDQLSSDLDSKWRDTLRKEYEKLERDLVAQKDEDKRAALAQVVKMKEEEVAAEREGWQKNMQQLLSQISELKQKLEEETDSQMSKIEAVKTSAEEENKRLLQEMLASAEQYAKKIESMEKMYTSQINQLKLKKEQDEQALEDELKQRHMGEMRTQILAHKTSLEASKNQAEKDQERALEAQTEQFSKELESVQLEMQHKAAEEMEEASRSHQNAIQAARMELERSIEIAQQKEGEFALQISDLHNTVRHREEALTTMEEESRSLQQGIDQLSQQLDSKGKDLLHMRREADQKLRKLEEDLQQEHNEELSNAQADHMRDKQLMLAEFNKAQELLKDKIASLQIILEEAEEKYRNRESRPEDLEAIQNLQTAVREREEAIQKLVDDKRFYQMELINRETNFNKVFSAAPNVGVLNPLSAGKKPKGGGGRHTSTTSSPALSAFGGSNQRLHPLPGSPLNDEKFNKNKPLPPTGSMKKFVK